MSCVKVMMVFYLAEQDLRWRGPGHLLGSEQTGYLSFKVADLLRDAAYLPEVNAACERLLKQVDNDLGSEFAPWLPAAEPGAVSA